MPRTRNGTGRMLVWVVPARQDNVISYFHSQLTGKSSPEQVGRNHRGFFAESSVGRVGGILAREWAKT